MATKSDGASSTAGFFHHAYNLLHPTIVGSLHIKNAAIRHLRRLHFHRQQHRTAMLLVHPNHLTHGGGGVNNVTKKHDDKVVYINIRSGFLRKALDPTRL